MRISRIFNGVDRIAVEWTVLGQRYRLPSMTLTVASLLAGTAVALLGNRWLGLGLAAVMAAAVVIGNLQLNRMDPDGALNETTQLGLLWRTARRPYITNIPRI
jgi:hypothetical protein